MASITAGLLETCAEAEAAMNDLVSNGFSRSDIGLKAAAPVVSSARLFRAGSYVGRHPL